MAADAQMGVDGAHVFQDRRIGGESSTGAGTDFLDFRSDASCASSIFSRDCLVDRSREEYGHFVDARGAFRANMPSVLCWLWTREPCIGLFVWCVEVGNQSRELVSWPPTLLTRCKQSANFR